MQRGRHRQRGCHQRVDGSSLSTDGVEKEADVILNDARSRSHAPAWERLFGNAVPTRSASLPRGVRVHTLTRRLLQISQGSVTKWFVTPLETRSVGTKEKKGRYKRDDLHRPMIPPMSVQIAHGFS